MTSQKPDPHPYCALCDKLINKVIEVSSGVVLTHTYVYKPLKNTFGLLEKEVSEAYDGVHYECPEGHVLISKEADKFIAGV